MDSSDRAGRQAPVTKNADADGNADQHREREQRKRQGEHQNILIKATVAEVSSAWVLVRISLPRAQCTLPCRS